MLVHTLVEIIIWLWSIKVCNILYFNLTSRLTEFAQCFVDDAGNNYYIGCTTPNANLYFIWLRAIYFITPHYLSCSHMHTYTSMWCADWKAKLFCKGISNLTEIPCMVWSKGHLTVLTLNFQNYIPVPICYCGHYILCIWQTFLLNGTNIFFFL